MNKRISYVTLISDMYCLLVFANIVYGIFFGFERIGNASFTITSINNTTANIIAIIEIIIGVIVAYLLHKCNYISIRVVLVLVCILNIVYRIINLIHMINPFTILMIFINIVLLIVLLLYKTN